MISQSIICTIAGTLTFTVCDKTDDVLGLLPMSLPYVAVMLCEPNPMPDVVSAAVPPDNTTLPKEFAPSKKVTGPDGLLPLTVAVNVMGCPCSVLLAEAVKLVVVLERFTVCVTGGDVLAAKAASPLYTAVVAWLPAASALVV